MLNQETKRRIDSARDILVGKVPDPKAQVEQITTALIYKFMDDMDKESEELGVFAHTNGTHFTHEKGPSTCKMIIKKGPTPRILSVVGIGVLMSCGKVFCAKRGKLSNDLYLWSGTPGVSRLSPP